MKEKINNIINKLINKFANSKYKIPVITFGISITLLMFMVAMGALFKGNDTSGNGLNNELEQGFYNEYTHYVSMEIDSQTDIETTKISGIKSETTSESISETTTEETTEITSETTTELTSEETSSEITTEIISNTSEQITTKDTSTSSTDTNQETTKFTGEITTSMDALSYKIVFENSVIMGDSIASGFSVYGVLFEENVVAKVGIGLSALDDEIKKVADKKPERIFCYYGFNDIGYIDDYEKFKSMYANFVKKLKAAVPASTKIYACAIFPALSTGKMAGTNYANTAPYNAKIKEVCSEYGIKYIDCSEVLKDKYYYEDGYHFRSEMYPYWLELLIQKGNII